MISSGPEKLLNLYNIYIKIIPTFQYLETTTILLASLQYIFIPFPRKHVLLLLIYNLHDKWK